MKKQIIINIVSGKGGTGKSLFVALLGRLLAQEGYNVLLVDLDVYVRGLTSFFYLTEGGPRVLTEKGQTIADFLGLRKFTQEISFAERMKEKQEERELQEKIDFSILHFKEVPFIPAVSEIDEELNFNLHVEGGKKITELFKFFRKSDYKFILLDNRAGIDEHILLCSKLADLSISISEDDPISKATNNNILRSLKDNSSHKTYTIVNKVRFIRSFQDFKDKIKEISPDLDVLGRIPFDVDLFENFGEKGFWNKANSTMYAYGVAESWNKLNTLENLDYKIDMERFHLSPFPSARKALSGSFNMLERMAFLSGVVCLLVYFFYDTIREGRFKMQDMFLFYGIGLVLLPFVRKYIFVSGTKH